MIAVYIKIFPLWLQKFFQKNGASGCPWALDERYGRQVAEKLNMPFYVFDLSVEYEKDVLQEFLRQYKVGNTPNPDVLCNRFIKFGRFLDIAKAVGADFMATGHYARRRGKAIFRAQDKSKDQSYFLWMLSRAQIEKTLFPLGDLEKTQVRKIAQKSGLPTAQKPDSQGICFLGQFKVQDFLMEKIKVKKGDIITEKGEKIGEHQGVWFYTIGQRIRSESGVELDFSKVSFRGKDIPAFYVVRKIIPKNQLIVGRADAPALYLRLLVAKDLNLTGTIPKNLLCQIRYGQIPQKCQIKMLSSHKAKVKAKVIFKKRQRAITIGQSIVFYQGEKMLGGGIIASR
ncbi:MAG: tRNA-specific 2-thiouridylase [Candidatus Berkelbacteria bacterium Licking1014_7]|uniref:tRNA-uridine 2-sulfurtransferase n=1 Tax=Candidatus Berkelbacteria bacterium Licking1014_7 TaxID=2017147 RepID=A0A554LJ24_9BACT|nr:MAG: tRNA-specific 2-thiouridylase [Candidatus Berkelbacteria bacterium Licking1014_7]